MEQLDAIREIERIQSLSHEAFAQEAALLEEWGLEVVAGAWALSASAILCELKLSSVWRTGNFVVGPELIQRANNVNVRYIGLLQNRREQE